MEERKPLSWGGIGIVAGLALAVLFCLPKWQVKQAKVDQGSLLLDDEYQLAKLEDEYRRTLAQILGGLGLLYGLSLAERRIVATENSVSVAQEGQVTERFTRAIDQLGQEGNDKMAIRLGGIYALERIAKDSEKDHGPVMEVLTAYVREKAPRKNDDYEPQADEKPPTDIQAILTVIGRRKTTGNNRGNDLLDLSNTHLAGVVIPEANLSEANLLKACLFGANLIEANLFGANLIGADLSGANVLVASLRGADLIGANLLEANLSGADLFGASLSGANLREADLNGADLSEADLSGASLSEADLSEADLSEAHLKGANLLKANLLEANLSGAFLLEANLLKANLLKANLSEAYLFEADLFGANLREANLSEADLREANLSEADLREASLSEASLSGADLREASLDGANLIGANLRGTKNLTANQVRFATNWRGAFLPEDLQDLPA